MATASRDETIRIWHVATQRLVQVFIDEAILYYVAFNPDGTKLVSGNDNGQVKVWDTAFLKQESKIVAAP
jgi:WD40 repeat protein